MKTFLFSILFVLTIGGYSQDTILIKSLRDMAKDTCSVDVKAALAALDSAITDAGKGSDLELRGFVYYDKAWCLKSHKLYEKAIENYKESLNLLMQAKEFSRAAKVLGGLRSSYSKGDLQEEGIGFFLEEISRYMELDQKEMLGDAYFHLALLHHDIDEYQKALEFHEKSLVMASVLKDSSQIASIYMSMGNCHKEMGDTLQGLEMYHQSLDMALSIGDKRTVAGNYNNIANVFLRIGRAEEALDYLNKALSFNEETGNDLWASYNYNGMANVMDVMGEHKKSVSYNRKSLSIKREIGATRSSWSSLYNLAENYRELERWDSAYYFVKKMYHLNDSLQKANSKQAISELEVKFDMDQMEKEVAILQHKEELSEAREQKSQTQRNALIVIAVLLLGGILVVFRAFTQKKEANRQIQDQKAILEEQNKEITDSINYAKSIQQAILPKLTSLESNFKDFFVYYRPKAIVSGDIYWIEEVGDWTMFSVIDCTGHGVPGAMVSVMASNTLSRVIREFELEAPGEVLSKLDELIVDEFSKGDHHIADGMDMSLCAFNSKTKELKFAGANNPLYLIRDGVLHEHKATKLPVGRSVVKEKEFAEVSLQLQSGDQLYLFSDGYHDQFGGDKAKKFKSRNFKLLLEKLSSLSLVKQKEGLHSNIEEWKRDLEQVDDICVLGVKIS